jgi:hypothetical protein
MAVDSANMLQRLNNRRSMWRESAFSPPICIANDGSVSRKLARANKGE